MAQGSDRELQDLISVHSFYTQLLEKALQHPVPVPREVSHPAANPEGLQDSIVQLKRWLRLVDMAVSAPMLRDALKEAGRNATVEALYRYYLLKASPAGPDRDKTDFLGSHLLRHPPAGAKRPAGVPRGQFGEAFTFVFSAEQAKEFAQEIQQLLGGEAAPLAADHEQLLREFQYLHQEADEFRHFDQLMDSGIVQRVRELKDRFGEAFYHPQVQAASAVYNVFFGGRFDDLFHETAAQIKAFAAKVQQDGGSIMSRVAGDVTVKNLTEVEESKVLGQDYGKAQQSFQKISKFKKAVDSRRSAARPSMSAAAGALPTSTPKGTALPTAPTPRGTAAPAVQPLAEAPAQATHGANVMEESKVRGTVASIRNFVRAADAKSAHIVPMRNGNLVLTPGETEAFRTDFMGEKSFRADYADMLTYLVALHTRIQSEMEDYKSKRNSSYLWKPHAESLAYLLLSANRAVEESGQACVLAGQRGLAEKVKAMEVTREKLRVQIRHVSQALETKPS